MSNIYFLTLPPFKKFPKLFNFLASGDLTETKLDSNSLNS